MQDFPRRKFNLCRLNFPIHIKKKMKKERKKYLSITRLIRSKKNFAITRSSIAINRIVETRDHKEFVNS